MCVCVSVCLFLQYINIYIYYFFWRIIYNIHWIASYGNNCVFFLKQITLKSGGSSSPSRLYMHPRFSNSLSDWPGGPRDQLITCFGGGAGGGRGAAGNSGLKCILGESPPDEGRWLWFFWSPHRQEGITIAPPPWPAWRHDGTVIVMSLKL